MTTENNPYAVGYMKPPTSTQFQRGISGNPGGNYKKTPHADTAYKRLGTMSLEDLRAYVPANAIEYAVKNGILRACEASDWQAAHAALKELADRVDGKAVQKTVTEHTISPETRAEIIVEAYVRLFTSRSREESLIAINHIYDSIDNTKAMREAVRLAIEEDSAAIAQVWEISERTVIGERVP